MCGRQSSATSLCAISCVIQNVTKNKHASIFSCVINFTNRFYYNFTCYSRTNNRHYWIFPQFIYFLIINTEKVGIGNKIRIALRADDTNPNACRVSLHEWNDEINYVL